MPIYEYRCDHCGHELEVFQKIGEPPPAACPACETQPLRKKISPVAFRLKGAGWYETDFKSDKQRNLLKDGDEAKEAAQGEAAQAKEAEGKEGAGQQDAAKDAAKDTAKQVEGKQAEGKRAEGRQAESRQGAGQGAGKEEKRQAGPAGKPDPGGSPGKRRAGGSAQSAGQAATE